MAPIAVGGLLVPLHENAEAPSSLPYEGLVTIGRRATCTIVCKDAAVSATHCVLKYSGNLLPPGFEVEDRSTNGTYVNDTKIGKNQSLPLRHGDILALTKMDPAGAKEAFLSGRPQVVIKFRLDMRLDPEQQPAEEVRDVTPVENAACLPKGRPQERDGLRSSLSSVAPTAEGFAQDLLVQEQRSKAKITGELMLVKRRLEQETVRAEGLQRELRKARAALDEERSRRGGAQETREKLEAGAEVLRRDRQRLEDLRRAHSELQGRYDSMEVELANIGISELSAKAICVMVATKLESSSIWPAKINVLPDAVAEG